MLLKTKLEQVQALTKSVPSNRRSDLPLPLKCQNLKIFSLKFNRVYLQKEQYLKTSSSLKLVFILLNSVST